MNDEVLMAGAATVLSPERIVLGAALAIPAALVAIAAITSLVRRDRARLGPSTRRFCSALGIGTPERRLLESRARGVGIPCAALLVSRGCFDAAAAHAPEPDARKLAAIRGRVFG